MSDNKKSDSLVATLHDQLSQAADNTSFWANKAGQAAKDEYYSHFGEGLGDYIGGRLKKMGNAAKSQAIEVLADTVGEKGFGLVSAGMPGVAGKVATRIGSDPVSAVDKAKFVSEVTKKTSEIVKDTNDGIEIGAAVGEATAAGTSSASIEAAGSIVPKAMAMSSNKAWAAASIVVAPTATVLTDRDGQRDIENGIANLKEDGERAGVALVDVAAIGSAYLPDILVPAKLKSIRKAKEFQSEQAGTVMARDAASLSSRKPS